MQQHQYFLSSFFRVSSADPFFNVVSRTTFQPSPSLCATNIYYNTRRRKDRRDFFGRKKWRWIENAERERRKRYIVWQYSKIVVEERKRKKRGERRRKYQTHLDWLAAMGHRVSSRLGWLKIGIENQVVVVVT